jgi:GT2 family glycosyltransferase
LSLYEKTDLDELLASGVFNSEWYRREYADVALSGLQPAEHYLWIGKKLGRMPNPGVSSILSEDGRSTGTPQLQFRPPFASFGVIRHNPLISVVIVSYNSSVDLEVLLPSIAAQTYSNLEVILVENGTENTEPLLRRFFSNSFYLRADNVGFAEGNNIALRISNGELVALINPDTKLDPNMLQELLDALRFDGSAAVAVPKIKFFERFIRLEIRADRAFSLNKEELGEGLDYRKMFVREGNAVGDDFYSNEDGILLVDLPYITPRKISCRLHGIGGRLHRCRTQVGHSQPNPIAVDSSETIEIELIFNSETCSSARFILNNAGSGVDPDGVPYDRGFGQIDDGEFYSKAYVQAMCGCAALIRRSVLIERELFLGPFFAYFEDSELSHWLISQGFKILYQPNAVVFHRHSETTEENSLLWQVLVGRSRRLYDLATAREPIASRYFEFEYPDGFDHPLIPKLKNLDGLIRSSENLAQLVKPARPTACVYNSYFSSMGGGEKHALDVASLLREKYEVYIASEEDFSIAVLEEYFSVNLDGVKKIISTSIDQHFTANFDLFVNSTFHSNLVSRAKKNLYLVSFPHKHVDFSLLENTKFLQNSHYTASWADKYWGKHDRTVLLPIVGQGSLFDGEPQLTKSPILLSVGRFTSEGHCKNHHLVLAAYRDLVDRRPEFAKWKLQIVGSCNLADELAQSYLERLKMLAQGYNVEILPNSDRKSLVENYRQAAIYVHAAGLGLPIEMPEKHEHFGITTFEAIAYGCLPVVYSIGGPAEQVKALKYNIVFENEDQLISALALAMERVEAGEVVSDAIRDYAQEMFLLNLASARSTLFVDHVA